MANDDSAARLPQLEKLIEHWRAWADVAIDRDSFTYPPHALRQVLRNCADELEALLLGRPQLETEEEQHRCAKCGHRWEGNTTVAELCGDCWRAVQPGAAVPPGEKNAENSAERPDRLVAAGGRARSSGEHGADQGVLRSDVKEALGNLLARINRDGGHRQATFSDDAEAIRDAEQRVIELLGAAVPAGEAHPQDETAQRREVMLRLEARSFTNTLEEHAAIVALQNRPDLAAVLQKASKWIRLLNGVSEPVEAVSRVTPQEMCECVDGCGAAFEDQIVITPDPFDEATWQCGRCGKLLQSADREYLLTFIVDRILNGKIGTSEVARMIRKRVAVLGGVESKQEKSK